MHLIAPAPGTRLADLGHEFASKPLLSEVEAKFYDCLESLSGGRCRIMCKPRLADFIDHEDGAGFNKISQKHVDFLIFRNEDWLPMMAIELDDSTHNTADRRKRDAFVNNLCPHIGLPLLRINVKEIEDLSALVRKLSAGWENRCQHLEASGLLQS